MHDLKPLLRTKFSQKEKGLSFFCSYYKTTLYRTSLEHLSTSHLLFDRIIEVAHTMIQSLALFQLILDIEVCFIPLFPSDISTASLLFEAGTMLSQTSVVHKSASVLNRIS